MKPRVMIVLLGLLALLAWALVLRPASDADQGEEVEEADADDPIVAPSRVAEVDGEARVVLDSAEVGRIGLESAALAAASAQGSRRLPGQVIPEPERVVTVRSPVAGRLTVEGARWPALGERVESGAPLGRVSDAQPLTAPMSGVVTSVGARPGEIVAPGQTLLELADNSHPVVRIAWPADGSRPQQRVRIVASGAERGIEATLIGPASEADPLTRQPAYLYRARGRWPGAVAGTSVSAVVSDGETAEGVLVPDEAVVQWEGLAWTYVRREPGQYTRVRVPTDQPAPGGWIVGKPFAVGDSVVVTGVQELLSEEFRARVTVGEESGE